MGLEDKDTTVQREVVRTVQQIEVTRLDYGEPMEGDNSPRPPVRIVVITDDNGARVRHEVPPETVANNWPGGQKTLRDWLLTLIGVAVEREESP